MERKRLGELMQRWHSSMYDPVYAVGSFYFAGEVYPDRSLVNGALVNLKRDRDQSERMLAGEKVRAPTAYGHTDDLREFAGLTERQLQRRLKELRKIIRALRKQRIADYGR